MTNNTEDRKKEHLKIALSDGAQIGDPGFSSYRFIHNALPEINFDEIDTSTIFLGNKINYPFFISCMTGGTDKASVLNRNLALAAQKYKIPMGLGSLRAAVENKDLRKSFEVRKYAPDIPILSNVGLVQLNYGFGLKEVETIIKITNADALVFHLNPIQEVIQPEGDRNFSNLLPKLASIISKVKVPVIVKEVGFGFSYNVVERLYKAGVRIVDTAGWGGTNWAYTEGKRREGFDELGTLFSQWGIQTIDSIIFANDFRKKNKIKDLTILASGGIRNGIDIAKSLVFGADMAGLAAPFGKAGLISDEEVGKLIDKLGYELKTAMFGVGAKTIKHLKNSQNVLVKE